MFRATSLASMLLFAAPPVSPVSAHDRSVALVLDASGSMKAALPDGSTRIDAAKTAVDHLIATLNSSTLPLR
jgi:hypothetical protein